MGNVGMVIGASRLALVTVTMLFLLPVGTIFLDFILLIFGFLKALTAVKVTVFFGFRFPSLLLVCFRFGSVNWLLYFKF